MTVGTELELIPESNALALDLSVSRAPAVVLEEAREAARVLRDVISQKPKPVIFNGQQYLEFEDWQTVGRFYGITAKAISCVEIQIGDVLGFKAEAEAILISTRAVISGASAMCLNDEPRWSTRPKYQWQEDSNGRRKRIYVGEEPVPLFQLMSMAQTRACAKALRNVLSWVVVLAGYRPTPAEEMTGSESPEHDDPPPQRPRPAAPRMPERKSGTSQPAVAKPVSVNEAVITEAQRKRFYAIWKGTGVPEDIVKSKLKEFGYEHSTEIRKSDYEALCAWASDFGRDQVAERSDYDDSNF
jgi:hypothetical protein